MPFKVSENIRFVKNLLYGYHGNCLMTSFFMLITVKMSMTNRYFSNALRNHKLEVVKTKLCVMIILSLYFSKSNFKVGGSAIFCHTLFYTFSDQIHSPQRSKSTKKVKKVFFGQILNSSLIFFLSLFWILGLSFTFYYAPAPYPVIIEVRLAKVRFQNLCLSKVIKENP